MKSKYKVLSQQKLQNIKVKQIRCQIAGQVLGALHDYLLDYMHPGISLADLDQLCYVFITKNNCKPSFLNYNGYPNTICASVNQVLIHAIPSSYVLKANDLVSIDVGCSYLGFHADFAFTVLISDPNSPKLIQRINEHLKAAQHDIKLRAKKENIDKRKLIQLPYKISPQMRLLIRKQKILDVTNLVLAAAIKVIRPNVNLQQVSSVIYDEITRNGYFTPKEFCGHGIGRKLHEPPYVGNIPWQSPNLFLREGMVICVEPMLIEFSDRVILATDNWTVLPEDRRSLSCHLEHTILVTQEGNQVLTKRVRKPFIENILDN